jgi:hypothetical protein
MYLTILFSIFISSYKAFATPSDYCKTLEIGESFTINVPQSTSKTKVEQKYSLKRMSEYEYVAYLNLKYLPKGELKSLPQPLQAFERKVDGCFDELAKQLTDEMGINIRLKRYKPESDAAIPKPPEVVIDLNNEVKRAHSRGYGINESCATIVHESFHLMGLVDEYHEKSILALIPNPNSFLRILKPYIEGPKENIAYDCRATGVLNSAMSSQNLAFLVDDKVLYSGQTRAIINPNCEQKNKNYYACGRLAYLTSKKNGSPTGCGETPTVCHSPYWLLTEESPLWATAGSDLTDNSNTALNFFDKAGKDTSKRKFTSTGATEQ